MIRKIIKINEEKCNGCGLCAKACHEGAIGMVNGKAKLLGCVLNNVHTSSLPFGQNSVSSYGDFDKFGQYNAYRSQK